MSNARKKVTVISCCITAIVCAALIVLAVTVLLKGRESSGFMHLRAEGLSVTLTREKLSANRPDENGKLKLYENNSPKDFSEATDENVFGIVDGVNILPGSFYSADMLVGTNGEGEYAYWLAVVIGESNLLAERLKVTVTVGESVSVSDYLNGTIGVGNESNPVAIVSEGRNSRFNIKVELENDAEDNNVVQDEKVYFDLVVYAIKL